MTRVKQGRLSSFQLKDRDLLLLFSSVKEKSLGSSSIAIQPALYVLAVSGRGMRS